MEYNIIASDWLDGFHSLLNSQKKKKTERVTCEQREILLNFISENPEMITHSSTRQCEKFLWDELVGKLNQMMPQKKYEFWKIFWAKWIKSLENKPEGSLTLLDCRLKYFLNSVGYYSIDKKVKRNKNLLTIKEIDEILGDLKKEKVQNNLEIDNFEYKIVKLKKEISNLKQYVKEKRKLNITLDSKNKKLLKKRQRLEGTNTQALDQILNEPLNKSN